MRHQNVVSKFESWLSRFGLLAILKSQWKCSIQQMGL